MTALPDVARRRYLAQAAALALAGMAQAAPVEPDGHEIISRVESLIWANTMRGEFEMRVVTPRWERTLALRIWMDRPKRSFIRILSPAKEAGIGSLRIGNEMWNYLPSVERVIKIPPSMMLQPWMGSDFTNDDLVKQSSAVDDYTHTVTGEERIDGQLLWKIQAMPKPESAVVWGRIDYWVRKDFIPVRQEFFSERGELVRVLKFSEIRSIGGRTIPSRWEIVPQTKPGQFTVITVKQAAYDVALDEEVFTQRNLQKR